MLDESVSLPKALRLVKRAKEKVRSLEALLPPSTQASFRERMVEQIERSNSRQHPAADADFQSAAGELPEYFDKAFGVNDFLAKPGSAL